MRWPIPLTGTDPKLERRVLDLFQVLLDLPSGERVAWIEAHSDVDSPLRQRLIAMLVGDRLANLRTGGVGDMIDDERLPERIGAYRITGLIGQGGMGAVYRGERMSGDFDHVAAIKLIRPGALSDALVERFQRERQTLASLSHPNIARLFDGGATDKGDPYIVMEYVDGVPLGTWIAEGSATKTERTALFLDICSAVGFAHQNLIVHRDITPSNILVASDGTAKLIDFGIAKPPVADIDAASSARKSLAGLSLTPGYAAPERVAGEAATTLSDVYSLGILLDRLLEDGGDADLRAIIAKASATDPAARYPWVDALADDVKAWRDGEVVAARNGGRRYAMSKFVARHRIGVIAAGAALALLLLAFAGTLWSLDRAQAARNEAESRFGQLRSLAGYMVFDLNAQLARTVGNAAARQSLVNRAQSYLTALAATPQATPDIKLEAARGLISLAALQGVPNAPNFGNHKVARANLTTAIAQLESSNLPRAVAAPDLATALVSRAMIEAHADTQTKLAAQTVAKADAVLAAVAPAQRSRRWFDAKSAVQVGRLELAVLGQDAKTLALLADGLDAQIQTWPASLRNSRAAEIDRALADYYRGIAAAFSDELGKAVAFEHAARSRFAKLDAERPDDPNLLFQYLWTNYVGYGAASGLQGHKADADDFLRTTRKTIDRLVALEPNDMSLFMFSGNVAAAEAQALSDKGKFREAVATQRSVVALLTRYFAKEGKPGILNRLVTARLVLGNIASQAGDAELACASFRESRALLSRLEVKGLAVGNNLQRREGLDRNIGRCGRGAPLTEFERF